MEHYASERDLASLARTLQEQNDSTRQGLKERNCSLEQLEVFRGGAKRGNPNSMSVTNEDLLSRSIDVRKSGHSLTPVGSKDSVVRSHSYIDLSTKNILASDGKCSRRYNTTIRANSFPKMLDKKVTFFLQCEDALTANGELDKQLSENVSDNHSETQTALSCCKKSVSKDSDGMGDYDLSACFSFIPKADNTKTSHQQSKINKSHCVKNESINFSITNNILTTPDNVTLPSGSSSSTGMKQVSSLLMQDSNQSRPFQEPASFDSLKNDSGTFDQDASRTHVQQTDSVIPACSFPVILAKGETINRGESITDSVKILPVAQSSEKMEASTFLKQNLKMKLDLILSSLSAKYKRDHQSGGKLVTGENTIVATCPPISPGMGSLPANLNQSGSLSPKEDAVIDIHNDKTEIPSFSVLDRVFKGGLESDAEKKVGTSLFSSFPVLKSHMDNSFVLHCANQLNNQCDIQEIPSFHHNTEGLSSQDQDDSQGAHNQHHQNIKKISSGDVHSSHVVPLQHVHSSHGVPLQHVHSSHVVPSQHVHSSETVPCQHAWSSHEGLRQQMQFSQGIASDQGVKSKGVQIQYQYHHLGTPVLCQLNSFDVPSEVQFDTQRASVEYLVPTCGVLSCPEHNIQGILRKQQHDSMREQTHHQHCSQGIPDLCQYKSHQMQNHCQHHIQEPASFDSLKNDSGTFDQDASRTHVQQTDSHTSSKITAIGRQKEAETDTDAEETFIAYKGSSDCLDKLGQHNTPANCFESHLASQCWQSGENMANDAELGFQLDREFDQHLADMKPYVLKLPHKAERQKCAVWIKKMCEPIGPGTSTRRIRNSYAQILLQMLKRESLHSPFDQKPEEGPLQPLPSYLGERLPNWVEDQLGDTIGSSVFSKSLGNPAAASTWVSSVGDIIDRPHRIMGQMPDKDPMLSSIRSSEFAHIRGYSADDLSIERNRSPPLQRQHQGQRSPPGEREKRQLPDVRLKEPQDQDRLKNGIITDMDWSKPLTSSLASSLSLPKGTTFYDGSSYQKPTDREVAVRTKMIEAKFHNEKLKLQQKHDTDVQKILDRKNLEIEDVKNHYKAKISEMEEAMEKQERRVQVLMKETEFIRQTKDKQISELKKLAEESNEVRRNEFEKRLHDAMSEFEQVKFELQKQHTQNIQEILDDTNNRLQRMEEEYSQQATVSTNVIKELQARVQQCMTEVESTLSQRSAVEREKNETLAKYEKLTSAFERLKESMNQHERDQKILEEAHEHELRSLKSKAEASLEYLKQEHALAASKAADTILELEVRVDHLKKSLKDIEEHYSQQIKEFEQNQQKDRIHMENTHDKQIHKMKTEMELLDSDWAKKVAKLEQQIKDKDQEITKLSEQKHQLGVKTEQALEDFKLQVEKNQGQIYQEMKLQMQQVVNDLAKSKQAREKQSKEFSRLLEDERYKHQHEVAELKMTFEGEKSQMLRDLHVQKEYILTEHERNMENLKELHQAELQGLEARLKERQDKYEKSSKDCERLVRELREELVQANQLRKQQLVELGLLREEEKQKMQRDHEAELTRARADMEQQKLQLQKLHSTEMENVLEKTNNRLRNIERDYTEKNKKSAEDIAELQAIIMHLRGDIQRARENSEEKLTELEHQSEEEKQNLRKQYSQNLAAIQRELEAQRDQARNAERQLQKEESQQEEMITQLKLEFEEKIRGLLPVDLRQDLEDTIASLRSQVFSLQQRSALLQEELNNRSKDQLDLFTSSTNPAIKSAV